MTKVATMKLIVATPITIINKSLTMISMRVVTPFLYRVGLSKSFYSFSVGFNGAFYGAF